MNSITTFIDIDEENQVSELRQYLKGKGAEISVENSPEGWIKDVAQIIEAADVCWKDTDETEAEGVLNSIVTLVVVIPAEKLEPLVTLMCEKLCKPVQGEKKNTIRVTTLLNLLNGLAQNCPLKYTIYVSLLKLAGAADLMNYIHPDLDQIKKWMTDWNVSAQKYQQLLRILHDSLMECKQSDQATKVMIELLGTYTEENASQARDDAHKCIVSCLGNPSTFLMDHLLSLKPVKFLEGELIHDLLTIFVSGKLSQYLDFYQTNKDFVLSIGLSHENNMHKMRLLTLAQMAEGRQEVSFETIQQEMKLAPDEVEPFIIEVVRTKEVRAKIDQLGKKVIISSNTHRTFGKQQWQLLREQLQAWQLNLDQVLGSLQSVMQH